MEWRESACGRVVSEESSSRNPPHMASLTANPCHNVPVRQCLFSLVLHFKIWSLLLVARAPLNSQEMGLQRATACRERAIKLLHQIFQCHAYGFGEADVQASGSEDLPRGSLCRALRVSEVDERRNKILLE